jgi:O-antigen ligase
MFRKSEMHVSLHWEQVQKGLFHPRKGVRVLTIIFLALAVGVPVGAVLGLLGATFGSALLIALAIGYCMMRSMMVGVICLAAIICLLPFAALPINIGFSPTFLDVVLGVLFFVWISRIVTHRQSDFMTDSPSLAVLIFMALACVSFIAGLSHAPVTSNVLRHFGEILLCIGLFFLIINLVRTEAQLRIIVLALMLFGVLAALIGIVLYFLPEELTVRLLSALRIVRYPSGVDVLRYIEDNPELALRATSTSVDPNVLGGMLIFVTTLTAAQVFSNQPVLPRKWLIAMLLCMLLCLVLSYSRGSFVGLVAALALMGLLRYRRILWLGLIILALMFILPPTQGYVQHFLRGVQVQDLATQMRFGEYKDAFILISRYPWFGVGFTGTPDIDTYLGVSSVYLLIAEEMGVLGLLAFLGAVLAFLIQFIKTSTKYTRGSTLEPLLLGTCLAVAGALVGGILDHYLFNLNFPHASALLWLMVGLGTVSIRLAKQPSTPMPRQAADWLRLVLGND